MILLELMRIAVLMFIVLGVSADGAYNYALPTSLGEAWRWSEVLMPHVSLVTPDKNWFICDYYSVYPQNQTIPGTILEPYNLETVGVAASRLNTFSLRRLLKGCQSLPSPGKVELLGFHRLLHSIEQIKAILPCPACRQGCVPPCGGQFAW